jgi:hypothetical protein
LGRGCKSRDKRGIGEHIEESDGRVDALEISDRTVKGMDKAKDLTGF